MLRLVPILIVLLLPLCVAGADRLNVLAIGQVLPGQSPIPDWFDADPLVDYVLVPTDVDVTSSVFASGKYGTDEAWRRYIRIYFPKTRKQLVENFDFFVFPDGYIDPFTPRQISDIRYAITVGLGSFLTTGGDLSSPSARDYPGWKSSALNEILPIELNDKMKQDGSAFSIRVIRKDPPLLSMFIPLGIESFKGRFAFTYLTTRPGATVWAKLRSPTLPSTASGDWLVSWRVGDKGGIFWVVADDLDSTWWSPMYGRCENAYAMDVFFNILLFSTGRPLPEDVSSVHRVRQMYWRYNQEKLLLFSLLDFVDRFGASTRKIEEAVDRFDSLKEKSFDQYRKQDFESAFRTMEGVLKEMKVASDEAMMLKDRALLWVYLTEWFAVTGTLFIALFVTYTLLVKRSLYREVGTTAYRGGH